MLYTAYACIIYVFNVKAQLMYVCFKIEWIILQLKLVV